MTEKVSPFEQAQWEAEPNEDLRIPKAYITGLRFEIIAFTQKKTFTFRCASFEEEGRSYRFENVIIDTSKRNPQGDVELKRVSFHPELILVNMSFMVLPAKESNNVDEAQES